MVYLRSNIPYAPGAVIAGQINLKNKNPPRALYTASLLLNRDKIANFMRVNNRRNSLQKCRALDISNHNFSVLLRYFVFVRDNDLNDLLTGER